jgi:hypothetical protein
VLKRHFEWCLLKYFPVTVLGVLAFKMISNDGVQYQIPSGTEKKQDLVCSAIMLRCQKFRQRVMFMLESHI